MKIKKGKLNYDQSGRAYPPNPRVKENWDCIWEYEGKYYKLVGDNEHKEWDEVNIYNQIIDEAYENFEKQCIPGTGKKMSKEEFVNICKTNPEFSETWGLKIEERELRPRQRTEVAQRMGIILSEGIKSSKEWDKECDENNVPTKLITLTYNNETIESYE